MEIDMFENGYQYLKNDKLLGGSILRPLNNSDTARTIKTPFLQALFDYREEESDYIGFF